MEIFKLLHDVSSLTDGLSDHFTGPNSSMISESIADNVLVLLFLILSSHPISLDSNANTTTVYYIPIMSMFPVIFIFADNTFGPWLNN